jgi:hypothetical protein
MSTPRPTPRLAPLLAVAISLYSAAALSAPSRADVAKADKLFKEARTLMSQGKFDAACPKLEESEQLDPAPGTRYQLAVCYESTGRPATALALYLEVADLAKAAGFKDKEKVAREKADALEPKVPRIVIEVKAARPSGLVVTRDGAPVEESQYGRPILVDPGDYVIEATAPERKPFKTTVAVKGEGARVAVPISLAPVEDFSRKEVPEPPPPKSSFGAQRIAAIAVGAAGAGGVVAGSVFGMNAKGAYDKAMGDPSLCPTKKTCYPDGKALVDQAQSDALISTITFIAGGVALAGGVVLFVTAPSGAPPAKGQHSTYPKLAVVPVATDTFAGVSATGAF